MTDADLARWEEEVADLGGLNQTAREWAKLVRTLLTEIRRLRANEAAQIAALLGEEGAWR